jgi:dTDP-glucose pyrophosphorylase
MLNVLVPLAGNSNFFHIDEYPFPKPLIEIDGITMIQHVISNLNQINIEKKFIFIVRNEDCVKYHLDNILRILTKNECVIIKLEKDTKGAACSALMAIDYINNNELLLISNGDQIVSENLNNILDYMLSNDFDAGTVCFNSIHPKWSYVKVDSNNRIIEAAEKRPISKNAIAGLYYFREGRYFVQAAMKSIINGRDVNGVYYIAPTLNELILENKILGIYKIEDNKYHSFYSPQKIKEYEKLIFKLRSNSR